MTEDLVRLFGVRDHYLNYPTWQVLTIKAMCADEQRLQDWTNKNLQKVN